MKKLTSIFLVLMLVLSLLPGAVLAQESETLEETTEEASERVEEATEEAGETVETTEEVSDEAAEEAAEESVELSLDAAASGSCGADGADVTWSFDSSTGTLTISGKGAMARYNGIQGESAGMPDPDTDPGAIGADTPWNGLDIVKVVIGSGVTNIGDHAFCGCSKLESVTIPSTVTTIGNNAFCNCTSLKSVTLPVGVTSIEDKAFYRCAALESVTLPDGLESIRNRAFFRCTSLKSLEIPSSVTSIATEVFWRCEGLESVTLPEGITVIGNNVFRKCSSLKNIRIPSAVTTIDDQAFYGCEELADVYYAGSESQWQAITVNSGNEPLTNAKLHFRDTLSTVSEVTSALDRLDGDEMTDDEKREAVKALDADSVKAALQKSDDAVKALEKLEGGSAKVETKVEGITHVSIIGAKLNKKSNDSQDIVLKVDPLEDKSGKAIPTGMKGDNAIYMDMTLDNVANTSALDVPVCVSFAVPKDMVWQRVRLVHYAGDEAKTLVPSSYVEGDTRYVRFVLDGFSPYALAERNRVAGDVDESGTVDIADVMYLLKYVAGVTGISLVSDQGNVNGDADGKVDIADVMTLLKHVAGVTGVEIN